ncbi:MAG: DUF3817 domain-containing protein [Ginsengibacter sp.]|jgi:integral membrane protein
MFKYSKSSLGRFRLVAISEGISYLLLLFIAMPLKYLAGIPDAVKYPGWVHGLLFMLYILALISVKVDRNWSIAKTALAFVISLIPFGAFFFDKSLRKEESLIKEEEEVVVAE